jgi:hypothetical protein
MGLTIVSKGKTTVIITSKMVQMIIIKIIILFIENLFFVSLLYFSRNNFGFSWDLDFSIHLHDNLFQKNRIKTPQKILS